MKTDLNEQLLDAVVAEDAESVIRLLRQGADPNCVSSYKQTPLELAIDNNSPIMTNILLENGSDPNSTKGNSLPLIIAIDAAVETSKNNDDVFEDSTEIIEILLRYGGDILKKDASTGLTAYDSAKGAAGGYHMPAQRLFEQILNDNSLK